MFQIELLARNLVIILFGVGWLVVDTNCYLAVVKAQTLAPLEIPQNDPLLPPDNINRELSPLEKKIIKKEIAVLETEANNQLQQGSQKQAFNLWLRQLRLYREISLLEEITALGRIGKIAWQINRSAELKVINQRLKTIDREKTIQNNSTTKVSIALGVSYQQVRDLDSAIAIYKNLYQQSLQEDNLEQEVAYLETLGKLYLNKFDYNRAATNYEKLLALSDTFDKKNNIQQLDRREYLQQLIKIYSYTAQTERAIIVKERIIDDYLDRGELEQIVKLKISLGDDYQALTKIDLAINLYREAIAFSRELKQIALASEALQKLAALYQNQEEYSLAIQTYEELIGVERQAYNSYGVMNSYDRIGKVYVLLENYDAAIIAFDRGLKLARYLNYQVSYFTDLITQTKAKSQ